MKNLIKSLLILSIMVFPLVFAAGVSAQIGEKEICLGSGGTWSGSSCTSKSGPSIGETIKTVSNVAIFLIGAVSVMMIIVGGFRYSTSAGDSSKLKAAKDTILYAIVGVVIAFGAYAVVNFVITSLPK